MSTNQSSLLTHHILRDSSLLNNNSDLNKSARIINHEKLLEGKKPALRILNSFSQLLKIWCDLFCELYLLI